MLQSLDLNPNKPPHLPPIILSPSPNPPPKKNQTPRKKAQKLTSPFPSQAFDTYIATNLTEHDPFDAQGRAANAAKLSHIIPYVPSTVLRHSFDNDIGFIHVRVDEVGAAEPIALADIYRMDGTCIVEHWDVTQTRPANATNPIAMF